MNFMKKTQATLACLLSLTLFAAMGISASADENAANPNRFEAEEGVLSGAAAIVTTPTAGADVSGGAFVGSLGQDGGYVEVTVVADEAGEREVTFGYCSMEARSIDVSVNGGDYVNIPTQGNGNDWNGNIMTSATLLYLNTGENVLKIGCVNGWAPNVDYVELGILDADAKAAAVAALEEEVGALPAEVTHDTAAAYESVVTKYEGFTDEQKALLSADAKTALDAAVEALDAFNNSLDQADADATAASAVKDLIDAIGKVTADSEAAITAARSAYDQLTDAQKAYVSPGTLKTLTNAEQALNEIKNPSAPADQTPADQTPDEDENDDSSSTVVIIIVAAVVVIAGVIVVAVVMSKKKK